MFKYSTQKLERGFSQPRHFRGESSINGCRRLIPSASRDKMRVHPVYCSTRLGVVLSCPCRASKIRRCGPGFPGLGVRKAGPRQASGGDDANGGDEIIMPITPCSLLEKALGGSIKAIVGKIMVHMAGSHETSFVNLEWNCKLKTPCDGVADYFICSNQICGVGYMLPMHIKSLLTTR